MVWVLSDDEFLCVCESVGVCHFDDVEPTEWGDIDCLRMGLRND